MRTNLYATDGLCHNAEPGTFSHACGKRATVIGVDRNGFASGFCESCKTQGFEAGGIAQWEVLLPRYPIFDHYPERAAYIRD